MDDLLRIVARLQEQVAQLERDRIRTFQEYADPAGNRRVRIGLQDDGSFGIRVWSNTGTLVHNYTTPG